MIKPVQFDVVGIPGAQGSKRAFVVGNRAVVVEGGSKVGREKQQSWRAAVVEAAMRAKVEQFTGPVGVEIMFFMPPITSDPHRTLHYKTPDGDKLLRNVLDGLTASGLIKDDALVWSMIVKKVYARNGHWTGATIGVTDSTSFEERCRTESIFHARNERKVATRGRTK